LVTKYLKRALGEPRKEERGKANRGFVQKEETGIGSAMKILQICANRSKGRK